jgi:hypothetical protein
MTYSPDDYQTLNDVLDEWEAKDPGFKARMEADRIERAKCPFEAITDGSMAYFTKTWKRVPYAWWNRRGRLLNRREFAEARHRDTIKRKKLRKAAKR